MGASAESLLAVRALETGPAGVPAVTDDAVDAADVADGKSLTRDGALAAATAAGLTYGSNDNKDPK